MEVYPGITMDRAVRSVSCVAGTIIDVAIFLGRFAAGDKIEDVHEDINSAAIKSWWRSPTQPMWPSILLPPSSRHDQSCWMKISRCGSVLGFKRATEYLQRSRKGLAAQHILLTDRGTQDRQIACLQQEEVRF